MSADLVDRLRAFAADCRGSKWQSREKTILLCDSAADEIDALQARVTELANLDCEAATHVESVIAMRTGFTGDPPYVGWKGLGLALNEALDAKEAAEQRVATLEPLLSEAESIPDYDAGLLNDWGGGNVEWWQDYLRAEIARANEHWRACVAQLKEGRG